MLLTVILGCPLDLAVTHRMANATLDLGGKERKWELLILVPTSSGIWCSGLVLRSEMGGKKKEKKRTRAQGSFWRTSLFLDLGAGYMGVFSLWKDIEL